MKKVIDFINKILLYGFFITGVLLIIYSSPRINTIITAFESFIGSIILAWLLKFRKLDGNHWIFINLALWVNLLGEIIAYYSGILVYDKVLHLLVGILISAIIYEYYRNNSVLSYDSVFFSALGVLAAWEIWEFFIDTTFGTQLQGVIRADSYVLSKIDDTMWDLILGSLGILSLIFFKKEKMGSIIRKDIRMIGEIHKKRVRFWPFVKKILRI
ncbi:MAG: hypothetical protein AABX17_00160 [Nanoarchaeota archaeon]